MFPSRPCRARPTPTAASTSTRPNASPGTSPPAASRASSTAATRSSTTSRSTSTRRSSTGWPASRRRAGRSRASARRSAARSTRRGILRRHAFRTAMMLPCGDPRDARGMEAGHARDRRRRRHAAHPLSEVGGRLRLRPGAGLDAVGRLDRRRRRDRDQVRGRPRRSRARTPISTGCCGASIAARVISGMGERPAVVHLRDFALGGHDDRIGLHRAVAVQRAARRPAPTANWTHGRERCAPSSCRSRTCATRGARRACCTTRPSSRASRRTGPIPPFVSPLERRAAEPARAGRARACGSATQ